MGLAESSSSDRQPERSGGMRSGLAPLFCFLAWPVISSDGADRVRSVNFWHLVYIDQRFRLHRRFGILGEPSPCPHRTSCTANEYPWMAAKKITALDLQGLRCGGDSWTRTNDPIDVNDVLYRLSHATTHRFEVPTKVSSHHGRNYKPLSTGNRYPAL